MDKAKAAITDFMGKSGHHDTTVHETVAPAVKHEVVKPHEHEEILTAVDKEVHQDHYHRTVQPVKDREVLPEHHDARLGGVVHREFDHRDMDATKRSLATEQAGFKDELVVEEPTKTKSVAPVVGGEHVHHHIHETIQPVLHKETIQPHVTHTTIPIHEVHHNPATLHKATALPAMTMEEFTAKGGSLQGREERYDGFEGEPKHIGGTLDSIMHGKTSKRDSVHGENLHKESMHGDFDPTDGHTSKVPVGGATAGAATAAAGAGAGAAAHNKQEPMALRAGSSSSSDSNTNMAPQHLQDHHKKPSLLKKLNPMTDADGDGKKGIMK